MICRHHRCYITNTFRFFKVLYVLNEDGIVPNRVMYAVKPPDIVKVLMVIRVPNFIISFISDTGRYSIQMHRLEYS